jgi:hypothetical protein
MQHPQKITLGEMRSSGVRVLVVFSADYKCAHSVKMSAERWHDSVRLSDLERQFVLPSLRSSRRRCQAKI